MGDDCHGDDESWECEAVADFLHRGARGAQGWRCHEGAAEVIDDDADDEVGDCDS